MATKKTTKTAAHTEKEPAEKKVTAKETKSAPVETAQRRVTAVKREFDPNEYVTVKNGFNGTLVYKSGRTGERFIWNEFGDEQDIQLIDLKSAKNSYKAFFINNWFLFDDPAIIEYLGVSRYYKHALTADSFDEIFHKSPDEIEAIISELSAGQKRSLVYRARQMIAEGEIDSIKVISTLEKCLAVELIEH